MDEWVVDRPHDESLRTVVGEAGERQPKRSSLLALWVRIDYGSRRRGHFDTRRHDGKDGTQIPFGRDPNNGVEKALSGWQAREGFGLAEARALSRGQHRARDGNFPNGDGTWPDVVRSE